jgi:hypothetical protein
MPGEVAVQLTLELPDDADDTDLEQASRRLRRTLLESEAVERVEHAPDGSPPSPDAKGPGGLDWGTLLVTLSASGGVLTALIGMLQAFLGRVRARGVTIQIGDDRLELTAASREEQRALLEAFLKRHPDH